MNSQEIEENESSDDDYVPEEGPLPSEEESDGEPEDNETDTNNKRKNHKRKLEPTEETETKAVDEPTQKKRIDNLWADFLKDTNTKPKPKTDTQKQTVTEVYKFANEEVVVTKELVEAPKKLQPVAAVKKSVDVPEAAPPRKSVGTKGISSILSQLGKKSKLSTLEKSKLDWNSFKKEENLEDELHSYNKGKNGYLARQDFLERTDLRQFEIEKNLRSTTSRTHRNIM